MWIVFLSMCIVFFSVLTPKGIQHESLDDHWIAEIYADEADRADAVLDDPKPVPSPSDKPTEKEIVIFMGVNCPPCERWKRCEMKKFQDAGWKVAICDPSQHSHSRTPAFSITLDGKTVEKVGYISFEEVVEVVQ